MHTEHALRQTDEQSLLGSESREDDVVTLMLANDWENQVVGVVRVERVWPARLNPTKGGFDGLLWV